MIGLPNPEKTIDSFRTDLRAIRDELSAMRGLLERLIEVQGGEK